MEAAAPNAEAAPAEATPAAVQSDATDGGDLFGLSINDIAAQAEATEGEQEQTETDSDAEQTDEAEPKDRSEKLDDEVIFSDKALETKEGLLKAKARVRELRKLSYEKYLELKKFDGRLTRKDQRVRADTEKLVHEKNQLRLFTNQISADLQALQSKDPDLMISALGRLTNGDGFQELERLNRRLITRQNDPELDPRIQAMLKSQKDEIDGLKRMLEGDKTQQQKRQLESSLNSHRQNIGQTITSQSQSLPHLARLYADDPGGVTNYIINEITEAAESGNPVDGRKYFLHLEGQLAKHFGASQAPKGDGGAETATKTPAVTAQRSPGRSVGTSSSSSQSRTPSNEEAQRQLAEDPQFWTKLGLGSFAG